jgi:hypothetical protein
MVGTLREYACTFMIISRLIFLGMRNVTGKSCRENQNTHFMFNKFSKIVGVMRYVWKSPVELDRPQMTMWSLHIACWITKDTDTQTEYVILTAFPLQQW